MHKVIINKLGPIEHCEIECSQFMTFTGPQASGKSTIAKALFFFRTIKNDIYRIAEEQALSIYSLEDNYEQIPLKKLLIDNLREKFLRIFGSSWGMDNNMRLEYYYTHDCYIKVYLKEDYLYETPNYLWIELSEGLREFLSINHNPLSAGATGVPEIQEKRFRIELEKLFDDKYEVVYIPAGRSMLTLLSQQLSYIYTLMKDSQKRTLDYCTQDYIERILRLKPEFSEGLDGVFAYHGEKNKDALIKVKRAYDLISKVLKGNYCYSQGEERINIENKDKYVKINYASSGQQEAVWILNLLFYYLVKSDPVMFIIEEPESHLFPESQKYITELISLISGSNHVVVVTTHSPYVLGTLNNLLYAANISKSKADDIDKIIPRELWIEYDLFKAWFVDKGYVVDCMDDEIFAIQNERIDEISRHINDDYDKLFDLNE